MGVVSRRRVCLVGVVVRRYIDFLILLISTTLVSALFCSSIPTFFGSKMCFVLVPVYFCNNYYNNYYKIMFSRSINKHTGNVFRSFIIESVDSISRDEQDSPLTQYITNAAISRVRYTITHFKHHHRVLQPISNRMSL